MSWRWELIILSRNALSFPSMGRHSNWVPTESGWVRPRMHLSSCPVLPHLLSIGRNPPREWLGQMGATTPGDTKCSQNPKMRQILGLVTLEICFLPSPLSHSPKNMWLWLMPWLAPILFCYHTQPSYAIRGCLFSLLFHLESFLK